MLSLLCGNLLFKFLLLGFELGLFGLCHLLGLLCDLFALVRLCQRLFRCSQLLAIYLMLFLVGFQSEFQLGLGCLQFRLACGQISHLLFHLLFCFCHLLVLLGLPLFRLSLLLSLHFTLDFLCCLLGLRSLLFGLLGCLCSLLCSLFCRLFLCLFALSLLLGSAGFLCLQEARPERKARLAGIQVVAVLVVVSSHDFLNGSGQVDAAILLPS
mmetsp:Transcript_8155/g.14104  ORF Transcript_8155/g.14104 Transcript_8155/m.14104 type:complete len:212 (-) Transcript_8155:400-1035(-)